jgi:3-oxoacyl-[acyl-carrier protein] reductase
MASKTAVVTGSSSGIGKAIALRLAAAGFDVIVHAGRQTGAARQVSAEVAEQGGRSTAFVQDFRNIAGLGDLVRRCWDWQGSVDVWINNAGADVLTGESAGWSFEDKLQAILQVDVVATLVLSREIGRLMTTAFEQDGQCRSIINIGWDQALYGMAGDSGEMFAASKGAIMASSKSLAQSLAPAVRVNCIAPGWIQTGWGRQASPDWQQRAVTDCLLDRWGQPDDVAGLAEFLTRDESAFINGQVICVNGGFRFGPSPITRGLRGEAEPPGQ